MALRDIRRNALRVNVTRTYHLPFDGQAMNARTTSQNPTTMPYP